MTALIQFVQSFLGQAPETKPWMEYFFAGGILILAFLTINSIIIMILKGLSK